MAEQLERPHYTTSLKPPSLDKAQRGNLGDVKPVGEGVFEMREAFLED
jgi:putative component of toxin-antitoxin plasmid stabilization module